jgi:hypothetical protein
MNTLDDKIKLLYDYVYSNKMNTNIKVDKVDMDNIVIDDIKIKKNNSDEYNDLITELFMGKFKELNYDKKNKTLVLKRYSDNLPISLFVTPYIETDNIKSLQEHNNNDALFSYLLSSLVLNNQTKHILLPIINVDVDFQQFNDVLKNYNAYDDFLNGINENTTSSIFSIRVKENFFKSMRLTDYLSSNECDLKKLLFQVIHTLAIVQEEYKGFRHNDMNANNILVYLKKGYRKYDEYSFKGKKYFVPKNKFSIKINNFSYSSIPGYYENSNIIPFYNKENEYFDLHYFLNTLLHSGHIEYCDSKTKEFLGKVIPQKYRNKTNSFYLERNVNLFSPAQLLEDPFFDEYLNEPMKDNMLIDDDNNDDYIYGTRDGTHNGSRKLRKADIIVQDGGSKYYKKPYNKKKNSPFITNENRNIYKKNIENEKKEIVKPERDPNIIAEQVVMKNPMYKPSFKPKKKNTWEHDYDGEMEKPYYVPKGKVYYNSDKSDKSYHSDNSPNNSDKNLSEERTSSEDYEKPRDEPKYDKYNDTRDTPKYNKPRYENTHNYTRDKPKYNKPRYENTHHDTRDTSKYDKHNSEKYYRQKLLPNVTERPVIAEQKVYQDALQPPPQWAHTHPKNMNPAFIDMRDQMMYPQGFVPEYNYMPNSMPFMNLSKPNEIPLQKIYNINLGNPTEHHSMLNSIYEDVLPSEPFTLTYSTLAQRDTLRKFLYNSLTINKDGEDMTLQGGDNSILSYLRLIEFNPYSVGGNPYRDIPLNFMIYSGAYPIKYDLEKSKVEFAKFSMGLNLRIYNLSVGALNCNLLNNTLNCQYFDVWREMLYYEFIRENILKQKTSPNFITLIAQKFDKVSNIDYKQLNQVIVGYKNAAITSTNSQLNNLVVDLNNILKKNGQQPVDLNSDSGVSLLTVTEAPTTNIVEWMSPVYEINGAVKKMTSTGYHTVQMWQSILFQLVHAMAVLQENNICFRNFSLENNVFIKDLFANQSNVGHWKYVVDDMEFYIPNFGYLLMIDSRFTDVNDNVPVLSKQQLLNGEMEYKLLSDNLFTVNGTNRPASLSQRVYEQFKEIFNENLFTELNNKYNITIPSDEVIEIVRKISSNTSNNIRDYLSEHFKMFLNNRVGTLLTMSEKSSLSLNVLPKYSKGKIVVYQSRYDEYRWAIYIEDNDKKKTILTKDDNNRFMTKQVFTHSLIDYNDIIVQTSKDNYKLNEDSLIETYKF